MDKDSRPRARTVFEAVEAQSSEQQQVIEPVHSPVLAKLSNHRWQLIKMASHCEVTRCAALIGILGTHLMTGVLMMPVLTLSIKVAVSALLFSISSSVDFTWIQAIVSAGGLWTVGPLGFFLYRYWSGKN